MDEVTLATTKRKNSQTEKSETEKMRVVIHDRDLVSMLQYLERFRQYNAMCVKHHAEQRRHYTQEIMNVNLLVPVRLLIFHERDRSRFALILHV